MANKKQLDTCSNCGTEARPVRGNYRYRESGLPNVILKNVQLIRCPKCGNEDPIIPRITRVHQMIALAVLHKPHRLNGGEVRFLRKHLGMNGDEFSKMIHIDRTTLSKWENDDDPVGDQSDRLIRAVVLGLSDELRSHIQEVVREFPNIEGVRDTSIQMDTETMSYTLAD